MLKDVTIFMIGGTGLFGQKFAWWALERFGLRKAIIYLRDVMEWEMAKSLQGGRNGIAPHHQRRA